MGLHGLELGTLVPAALAGVSLLVLVIGRWPRAGTLLFFGAAYANLPVVLGTHLGSKPLFGALIVAPLAVSAAVEAGVHRRGLRVDRPFVLMGLYLGAMLISSLVAHDASIALEKVGAFVIEGLVVYFLILNAMRSLRTLRGVVWTLLAVAAVLSCLGLYQEMKRNYDQQFWGLALHDMTDGVGAEAKEEGDRPLLYNRSQVSYSHRMLGPVGDANFFAQVLIMLLPLALWRIRHARGAARVVGLALVLLVFSATMLTYSRGGALALGLLAILLVSLGYVRLRYFVIAAAGLLLLVQLVAPGYLGRMDRLASVLSLGKHSAPVNVDPAATGRLTEMLAALHVFLDHPLLGVGPGQFTPFYSEETMRSASVAFKYVATPKEAHSLYFGLAADTGILGLLTFFGIIGSVMWALWRQRQRWLLTRPEYADAATACLLALVAYLCTSVFLHLAFQRYYWLFLGVGGATAKTLADEPMPARVREESSVAVPRRLATAPVTAGTPPRIDPCAA